MRAHFTPHITHTNMTKTPFSLSIFSLKNGCGASFRWTQAKAYQRAGGGWHGTRAGEFNRAAPTAETRTDHQENCSVCAENITGVLLRCVNCNDNVVCCVVCQDQCVHVYDVDDGDRVPLHGQVRRRGGRGAEHEQSHVFRIEY